MQSFWTALLDHPILLVIMLMFFMGFVGMTYEFILRLCGKSPFLPDPQDGEEEDEGESEPPEPANVPKPPTGPKDVLEGAAEIDGAEEIEDDDGTKTYEYIYRSEPSPSEYGNWDGAWDDAVNELANKEN